MLVIFERVLEQFELGSSIAQVIKADMLVNNVEGCGTLSSLYVCHHDVIKLITNGVY